MGQMMEPVVLNDVKMPVIEKPWATNGTKNHAGRNIINSLSLLPEELEVWNHRRYERYAEVEKNEVMYEEFMVDDADIVVVAFGIAARVSKNAIVEARNKGIKVGLIRPITLWPFPKEALKKASKTAKAFISVELNMGQMIEDVKLAINCSKPVYFVGRTGGMIPSPEEVLAKIKEIGGAK